MLPHVDDVKQWRGFHAFATFSHLQVKGGKKGGKHDKWVEESNPIPNRRRQSIL
jgi:hypothetical protein